MGGRGLGAEAGLGRSDGIPLGLADPAAGFEHMLATPSPRSFAEKKERAQKGSRVFEAAGVGIRNVQWPWYRI